MKTSPDIKDISSSLIKARASMTGAKRNSRNKFFDRTYSDLESVMTAISKPFADNNLGFVQGAEANGDRVSVSTRIIHTSGQWIESSTELPPFKGDVQGWGSAFTYAKRYGLQSLVGIPSVDDDGHEAVKQSINLKNKENIKKNIEKKITKITKEQVAELSTLIGSTQTDLNRFFSFFSGNTGFKITELSELPAEFYLRAKKTLNEKKGRKV